jgi:hypothetical protein
VGADKGPKSKGKKLTPRQVHRSLSGCDSE